MDREPIVSTSELYSSLPEPDRLPTSACDKSGGVRLGMFEFRVSPGLRRCWCSPVSVFIVLFSILSGVSPSMGFNVSGISFPVI